MKSGSLTLVPRAIEQYSQDHSVPENTLLKALATETYRRTRIPQMQVGHLEGAFLRLLVRFLKARRILEIGTFTGYSALVMAEALPPDGHLITCDIDDHATQIAKRFWKRSVHGRKIQLKLGTALDILPRLKGLFDLIFIDADKENYSKYWALCVPKVRSGGLLVVDNVLWSGRVLRPKTQIDQAIVNFNEIVLKDSRVEPVMLTVRDGITLAYKL